MVETVLRVKVDEFLAHKIENIVKKGTFKNEEEFLKSAAENMVQKWEIQDLNIEMDKIAEHTAKKYPANLTEAVLKAREEDDDILLLEVWC